MTKIPIFLSPNGKYIAWADNPRFASRAYSGMENHDFEQNEIRMTIYEIKINQEESFQLIKYKTID